MDRFERIWRGMTQSERIVAMSLLVGGVIGIANSTVWAVATCYIAHQRTRTRVAQFQAQSLRQAPHVRIDNDTNVLPKRVPQHHVRGLPPHAREMRQFLHRLRHPATVLFQ